MYLGFDSLVGYQTFNPFFTKLLILFVMKIEIHCAFNPGNNWVEHSTNVMEFSCLEEAEQWCKDNTDYTEEPYPGMENMFIGNGSIYHTGNIVPDPK